MKRLLTVLLLGAAVVSRADEIEPAVDTSSIAPAAATTEPAPASEPAPAATTAAPTSAPVPAPPAAAPAAKGAAAAKKPAGQKSSSRDEITLDPTQITGNKELPNVMYVVPWKRPDIGDMNGRPPKSLIDEALAPVDRDVFRRQNRYFAALQSQTATAPVKPTTVAPAAGATATLPNRDEK
jgi:hypothetical protein